MLIDDQWHWYTNDSSVSLLMSTMTKIIIGDDYAVYIQT